MATKKQNTQATKNGAKSDVNTDVMPEQTDNVENVSSTDFDSIFSAWLNARDIKTHERDMLRDWKQNNVVQWTMNTAKTRGIAVYRHHDKITQRANDNYLNKGFDFVRVYSVVLREHAKNTKNDSTYVKSTVLATVGYDNVSQSFVLLSNVKLTVKTRTAQGSELDTLDKATYAVIKAINTATQHGEYTAEKMFKVDTLAPTLKVAKVPTRKNTENTSIL